MSINSLDKKVPRLGIKALCSLAFHDFKRRYTASALGGIWAFISPILTLAIYWLVFNFIFDQKPVEGVPYGIWLIIGTLPWLFISDAILGMTLSYTDYSFLIAKVRFRAFYLPQIRLFASFFVHMVLLFLVTAVIIFYGVFPNIIILYFIFSAAVFVYALGRITALIQVYMRGTAQAISAILQLLFWVTPVFWDYTVLPENLQNILTLSPFFYTIEGYRDSFFKTGSIDFKSTLVFWIICIGLLIAGETFYKIARPTIADKVE